MGVKIQAICDDLIVSILVVLTMKALRETLGRSSFLAQNFLFVSIASQI